MIGVLVIIILFKPLALISLTMSENNRRNILFAVAGAGLLIGAALLFHWANQSDDDTTDGSPKVDLKAELTALGLIKPKKQGSILDP